MQDDNVTPIAPGVNPETERLDEPYSTPARAVAAVLRKGNFDKAVIGIGPVEIRMIAEFTDRGAQFHAIGVAPVMAQRPPTEMEQAVERMKTPEPKNLSIDAPAMTLLRILADTHRLPRNTFVNTATVAEIETIDVEISGLPMEIIIDLCDKNGPATAVREFAPRTVDIINRLVKENAK